MAHRDNLVDSLDLTPRRSVWLDQTSRDQIALSIESVLADKATLLSPEDGYLLQQVLSELHVVAARAAYYPGIDDRERLVEGRDPSSEPVRLSDGEARALLMLVPLAEHIAEEIRAGITTEGVSE